MIQAECETLQLLHLHIIKLPCTFQSVIDLAVMP